MAEQPTRGGADGGPPAGDRSASRARSVDGTPAAPLTVAELLARSGTAAVPRRRAERRESTDATGRLQPVREDDGSTTGRPPLRGGIRRDPVGLGGAPAGTAPPVLPTGWQPAMPAPQPDPPADPPVRRPEQAPPEAPSIAQPGSPLRPARPATPPRTPAPPVSRPTSTPSPVLPPGPSPAGPPPVPPRPSMRALLGDPPPEAAVPALTPAAFVAPRVVPPVSVTPAPDVPLWHPTSAPSATPPSTPAPSSRLPAGPAAAPLPYASAPAPGVRRSLPLPPIPGRDLAEGGDAPTEVVPLPVRAPMSPARRRATRVALSLVALLGLVAAYYVGLYFYADQSMDRVDALVVDGPEILAPQLQESSQTYLIVGTGLPGRTGISAVSTLIAHVSTDDDTAVLVTVPPTALSDTPTCRDSDGEVRPAVTEAFATALLDGGPSCLVRSVQQLTGLRVDHYLAVDLERLPGMVDALGEVPVCLTSPSAATGSSLELPAGDNQLSGEDVTGFLQSTGSDVTGAAAALREQLVLASTLSSALDGGTLADPLTLTRFLTRAGDAFTVDAETTLADVRSLGATLGGLSGDQVEHGEVPVAAIGYVPAGTDQAAVVVDATATRQLFDAVIDGGRLPVAAVTELPAGGAAVTDPAASGGTGAADSLPDPTLMDPVPEGTTVSVAPAGVTLDVLDATGASRTTEVADGLAAQGFQVRLRGVEPGAVDRTVVRYGPASLEPARTVAAAVPGSLLLETDEVGGSVQLVIGPDYTGLTPVAIGTPVPTTAAPAPVETGSGAASACS